MKPAGRAKYAACGQGRIQHTLPIPFVPGADDTCVECAERVREQR